MKKEEKDELKKEALTNAATEEIIDRYGSANAEFIKGYRGVDNETGQTLNRGLKKISKNKINPEYKDNNIKQQAGYSAEVNKVSRDNAENIVNKSDVRTVRTDDHPGYGSNDQVYDHVQVIDGEIISGSGSQMKFVNSSEGLMDNIAKGEGGGKNDLSRYQGVKLDLPSDQVEQAKKHCEEQVEKLNKQAERLEKEGKTELAAKKRAQAKNYKDLKSNIRDSGMTRKYAIFLRQHPELATALEIANYSHQAGIQASIYGAAIGGSISIIQNIIAINSGDKELGEALKDISISTGKTAVKAYGTGFAGAAIKGSMQQSKNSLIRSLSKTSLPSTIVSICLELGSSIKQLVQGEVDTLQFFEDIGEKGTGLLAAGLGGTIGQVAIPIPIVGGMIGSMIGYTLSSMFYAETINAFKELKESEESLQRTREFCRESIKQLVSYREEMEGIFSYNFSHLQDEVHANLESIEFSENINTFEKAIKNMADLFDHTLEFETIQEFKNFMDANKTLIL